MHYRCYRSPYFPRSLIRAQSNLLALYIAFRLHFSRCQASSVLASYYARVVVVLNLQALWLSLSTPFSEWPFDTGLCKDLVS